MQDVNAKIQRNGFSVLIAEGVSIFFTASQENITRLMSMDEKDSELRGMMERAERYLKPVEQEIQNSIKEDKFNTAAIKKSIEIQVEFARELYDYIYGIGIFDGLYEKIHDVSFWLENMEAIFQATLGGLEAEAKARRRKVMEAQKKYFNKKNHKRKR